MNSHVYTQISQRLAAVFLLLSCYSCSSNVEKREINREIKTNVSNESDEDATNRPSVRTTKSTNKIDDSKYTPKTTDIEKVGINTTDSGNTSPSDEESGLSDAQRKQAALAFFDSSLASVLESSCISCHVGPRVDVAQRGTEGIYVADNMYELMIEGSSSSDNSFYNKVNNKANSPHTGGDRCATNQNICDLIIAFGQIWYEDDGLVAPPEPEYGLLDLNAINGTTNYQGVISGWAFNSVQPDEQVMVEIYSGPIDTGTLLVSDTANRAGIPQGKTIPAGNHKFAVKIPDTMIDHGNEMDIYAYAVVNGDRILLGNAKETFYVMQDANFFENEIAQAVTAGACGNCHADWSLEGVYETMVIPKPSDGGTATNNKFYLAISGSPIPDPIDPTITRTHSGGNRGADLSNLLRQWWELEFGVQ